MKFPDVYDKDESDGNPLNNSEWELRLDRLGGRKQRGHFERFLMGL